ncbi:MAG: ABC transporter permease [Planctomycetes bacterium]|nr:ABC transporter permease [Planctomycetota bacterium]
MRATLFAVFENTKLAFETLVANRMRSFLTVLGIFIGVLLVVAVASVLNGFRQSVVDQVEEFGTNNLYVYRMPLVNIGRMPREMRLRRELSLDDAWAIRDLCPSVEMVSPGVSAPTFLKRAVYRDEEVDSPRVRGVFPNNVEAANRVIEEGRFFGEQENEHRVAVVVLGAAGAEALFPNGGGVGKEILIGGNKFTVIGICKKRREGPFGGQNEDDTLFLIPYYTLRRFYPGRDDHFIAVRAIAGKIDSAKEEISEVLRRRRRVRWDEDDNFEIGTADSLIAAFDGIVFAALAVMFLLSTVGFMVGGVGVMNIMLVSVKERTREIGVRKAVGARRRDIMGQFLVEAVVMCLVGGVLGLLVAEGLLQLVAMALPGMPVETPLWARVFAFAGSGGIGLFFGLWPAWKAASLDPIEALRYE